MIKTIITYLILFWIVRSLIKRFTRTSPKKNNFNSSSKSSRKDGLDIKDAEFEDIN